MSGGFVLRVFAELDEDDARFGIDPGCVIELSQPGEVEGLLREAGVDLELVNLIVPQNSSVSIYFDRFGGFEDASALVTLEDLEPAIH